MAPIPVLTAVSDPRVEVDVAATLAAAGSGVVVVRRCVDLAELLAAADAGLGRVAVVSADLRRLDREALTRLAVDGVAVVGLVTSGDDAGDTHLRGLGITHRVRSDGDVAAAIGAAASLAPAAVGARDWSGGGGPGTAPPGAGPSYGGTDPGGDDPGEGRVLAVWGPTGGPGRTTLAVSLAAELAALGRPTLLVDADVQGGVVAQVLGLLDEAPGLAAACRLATTGALDVEALAELATVASPGLRVLTGISRGSRWPELRPSALDAVLGVARQLADHVVVDLGFCLESDEELSYDTVAPRRHGATLQVLAGADTVIGVAAADPVGLQRYVRALGELAVTIEGVVPLTVVNKVRSSAVGGGNAQQEIEAGLWRFAGVQAPRFVPLDVAGCDAALAAGRTLAEAAPRSPVRLAVQALARELAGVPIRSGGAPWRRGAQARSR